MSKIGCRLWAGWAAAWAALPALAAVPPAPAGWMAGVADGVPSYRLERDGHEMLLRVYTVPAKQASLDAWFDDRMLTPPAGISNMHLQRQESKNPAWRLSTGDGRDERGRPVYLTRLGCSLPTGERVAGEIQGSPDPSFFGGAIGDALGVFRQACTAAPVEAPSRQAAAPARPAGPPPYPYIKPIGTGLKPSQIEGIVRTWTNDQAGMTMQVHVHYYLLLKDGSFYADKLPPAALSDFDVAASKQGEPGNWGRWTKAGEGRYRMDPGGNSQPWILSGAVARLPARPDEKLDGTWEGYSAYSTGFSVSQSHWSVTFTPDGRFSRSSSSSIVGSAGSTAAGTAVGGTVTRDDKGSTSTMGGGNFSARSRRVNPNGAGDREGSYRLDGYDLELRYDNGRVERVAFAASPDRGSIWFENDEIDRAKRR